MSEAAIHMIQALRDDGLRVTTARRAVCEVLAESQGEHLSAADVLERVARSPDISVDQSTIYRTLETLERAGLITHTHFGQGPLVYHLADEPPHQHLVCISCGRAEGIPESELRSFFDEITTRTGFVPDPTHMALSGRCAECAARDR